MEIILLLVIILFLLLRLPELLKRNGKSIELDKLTIEIEKLRTEIVKLQQAQPSISIANTPSEIVPKTEEQVVMPTVQIADEIPQPIVLQPEEIPTPIVQQAEEIIAPLPTAMQAEPVVENVQATEEKYTENIITPIENVVPIEPKTEKIKTNIEQFIGEKLISIIGISILVLGIVFSVKWAIDKHLISDAGKIMIGLLSGTILISVAHKLSKQYRAFSSILAGGGIAILYFSMYEAYQTYQLLPQSAAFVCMVLVTVFAVILSVVYDKKELAIIAIVGGFGTPFMLSNHEGNYQVLFTYLLVLNIGMFALAFYKKWNLVNIICYGFTFLIYGAWFAQCINTEKLPYSGALLFATLFFIVFFGMNIIYNIKHKMPFKATEIVMLLSNSLAYFGVGLYALKFIHGGHYQGIFTISLAIFYFAFAYVFYKKNFIDKNLIYLLIGLVLTFVSLTAPIQLHGNYITLFWSCETVLLYWLGVKSNIGLIKNSSIVVLVLLLFSLSMDWQHNYWGVQVNKYPILFNKICITGLLAFFALLLKQKIVQQDDDNVVLVGGILPKNKYLQILKIISVVVIYLVGILELSYQTFNCTLIIEFKTIMLWLYNYLFFAIIFYRAQQKENAITQKIIAIMVGVLLFFYVVAYNSITEFTTYHLTEKSVSGLYAWHYLLPIFAIINALLLLKYWLKNNAKNSTVFNYFIAFIATVLLFIISSEVVEIWAVLAHKNGFDIGADKVKATKTALPILWSMCSLALMYYGMKNKIKILRIVSLTIFSITILKLFVYDISNVGQGGKILAFVILGIVLLIVSFMYQKIKDVFTDENKNENEQ